MKYSFIKSISILALFCTLGFGIYSNALEASFYFDDIPTIKDNVNIRVTRLTEIGNAGFKSSSTRPIAFISFALNYYFHQYNPKSYHVVNIIIHILTGILLYLFIKTTLSIPISKSSNTLIPPSIKPASIAFFTALIWLVNPLHIQSVTYIVQRMNSMASMFFILSLLLYAKGRMIKHLQLTDLQHDKSSKLDTNTLAIKRKTAFSFQLLIPGLYFSGAFLSWTLALGCKQTTATLPFFIFLYDWYFFQDLSKDWLKRQLKYLLVVCVLFGFIAFLYLGFSPLEKITSIAGYANKEFTFAERVLTQPRVVLYYLSLLFFPHPSRLNLDYDFPLSHSLIDPVTTLLSLCIIFGFIGLAVYTAKKERLLSFCILWFFGNLVIESSVIPLAIIFEHRTYLPSMLVCLLAVALGHRYIKYKWAGVALVCIVAAVFSLWTYQRNSIWSDPVSLWSDCVVKSPQKARPHNYLGLALDQQGRTEEAIQHYLQALRIKPDFEMAHNNLGVALDKQGRTEEAVSHYLKALQINPDYVNVYNNLGNALLKQSKAAEAVKHFNKALRLNPKFVIAYNSLSVALIRMGKPYEAIDHLQKALQIYPNHAVTHANLGGAFISIGRIDEAIVHCRKALQIKPDLPKAHMNLGIALANTGKNEDAIAHLRKALQIDPNNVEAQDNLNIILATLKEIDEEIKKTKNALMLNPEEPILYYDLGNLYKMKGKFDQAITHYQKAIALNSEFPEALYHLARLYIKRDEYEKALQLYQEMLTFLPDNPTVHYNIACIYAQQNRLKESITWLKRAVAKGFADWELIKSDSDLNNIRGSLPYEEFMKGH